MDGSNGNTVTAGDDTIIGVIDTNTSANSTLNATDLIDAGDGTDTLKVVLADDASTTNTLPTNFENVEVVSIQSNATGTFTADVSGVTGVENLNITKAAAQFDAVASATTDVDASMKAADAALNIDGGNNVNVALTGVTGANDVVTVGGGATQAKGDVTVDMTGAAYADGDGDNTLSAVNVTGGSTVNVTQSAASDASGAETDTAGATITQGKVTVNANTDTTDVTVKQDASQAEVAAVDAVEGVATTQEITFEAMSAGETVTLSFQDDGQTPAATTQGLSFTAKKDLTADQVASAFANLDNGDIQVEAAASLGLYTDIGDGAVADNGKWSSGEVITVDSTKSKVVFTNADASVTAIKDGQGANASTGGLNNVGTLTVGTDAVEGVTGQLGVVAGQVDIEDSATAATIETITIDSFGAGSDIGSDTAGTSKLSTLNLSNSSFTYGGAGGAVNGAADLTIDDTAATFNLVLENVGHANVDSSLTLTDSPTTMNVTSNGNNYVDITETNGSLEALNVDGTGLLDVDGTDLATLETVAVTGEAGLKLNGGENDTLTSVDTTGTTGTVTASINGDKATYAGGAGVDRVTVANPATAISKSIDLGAGDDRLDLTAGTPLTPSEVVEGGEGEDTIVLASADAASTTTSSTLEGGINGFEKLEVAANAGSHDTVNLDNLDDINYVITNGDGSNDKGLILDKMLAGATVEIKGDHSTSTSQSGVTVKLADASGAADVVNLIANADETVDGTQEDLGTVTVDKVETVNITANDTDTDEVTAADAQVSDNKLTLDADAAASINVTGEGNLELVLDTATTEVTTVDASAMNGALTLATLAGDSAATTVTGGAGDDTLTAKGANDVLIGGAGDDTLKVDGAVASATTLTGGEGTDSFDVSSFLAANGGSAVTITDLEVGETIKFNNADGNENFATGKVQLIEEATFSEYVQEAAAQADAAATTVNGGNAAAGGIAWFEFNQNTFIVQDTDGDGAFTDGADAIVKLSGVVDLGNSSFSQTDATLEYIA